MQSPVIRWVNQFKMSGLDAGTVAARVVYLEVVWYLAHPSQIGQSVCPDPDLVGPDLTISV
jgi:hypothetical protein